MILFLNRLTIIVPILTTLASAYIVKKEYKKCDYKKNIIEKDSNIDFSADPIDVGVMFNRINKSNISGALIVKLANEGYIDIDVDKKKIIKAKKYDGNDILEKVVLKFLFLRGDLGKKLFDDIYRNGYTVIDSYPDNYDSYSYAILNQNINVGAHEKEAYCRKELNIFEKTSKSKLFVALLMILSLLVVKFIPIYFFHDFEESLSTIVTSLFVFLFIYPLIISVENSFHPFFMFLKPTVYMFLFQIQPVGPYTELYAWASIICIVCQEIMFKNYKSLSIPKFEFRKIKNSFDNFKMFLKKSTKKELIDYFSKDSKCFEKALPYIISINGLRYCNFMYNCPTMSKPKWFITKSEFNNKLFIKSIRKLSVRLKGTFSPIRNND